MSPAFFFQCEITQLDRWKHGPVEIVILDTERKKGTKHLELAGAISEWNMSYRGGVVRPGRSPLFRLCPWLNKYSNPNLFFAASSHGLTELHQMLASILPPSIATENDLRTKPAHFGLVPVFSPLSDPEDPYGRSLSAEVFESYGRRCESAFEGFIWSRLAGSKGQDFRVFAADSPLRLLAGDTRYWMHRLYKIAISRNDELGIVDKEDESWAPLAELQKRFLNTMREDERGRFQVTRPHYGGVLWDPTDDEDRESVVNELISGNEVVDSIEPVLETLKSHRTHEDFSDRWSWIKEDFERSFHSKRSKIKVTLMETLDDVPVWDNNCAVGLGEAIFRDFLSFFDRKDQHLLIALREGRSLSGIANAQGLRGHASISRKLARIKTRLQTLIGR